MNIGKVAARTGVEASAIRFYEKQGIVPEPTRTTSGYRLYREEDVELIQFVKRARSLGIPLDDIREIIALKEKGEAPCYVVRTVISREAASIKRRIAELEELHRELLRLEALAEELDDDWPNGACVCHIVEAGI